MAYPEWFERLQQEQGLHGDEYPDYELITLAEFCGRFGLSENEALWKIKEYKLWGCGKPRIQGNPFGIMARVGMRGDVYYIPLPEADRYAAILEAEKQQEEPPPCNSTPYMNKKHAAYSVELEAAVSCWLALFADAAPGTIRLIGRDEISKWLKENRPKAVESKAALDRVVTIVNPKENKGGGAKPTP